MSSASNAVSLPAPRTFLALIPGLVALFGLVTGEYSAWTLFGLILLLLFIGTGWVQNNRRLPDWSLMAVGMVVGSAVPLVLSTLGVLLALATGASPKPATSPLILAIPWIGIAGCIYLLQKQARLDAGVWRLAGAFTACCLLVRLKYIFLFGLSWPVIGEMTGLSLWAAGTLLLPTLIGGFFARRCGAFTFLFAVGASYAAYQLLIDNGYKVSANLGPSGWFWMYLFVVRFLFIVLGPWLYLRLADPRRRVSALVLVLCASAVVNIVVSGLVRGDFTLLVWLSAIPYTLSLGLSLLLADRLYRSIDQRQRVVS